MLVVGLAVVCSYIPHLSTTVDSLPVTCTIRDGNMELFWGDITNIQEEMDLT